MFFCSFFYNNVYILLQDVNRMEIDISFNPSEFQHSQTGGFGVSRDIWDSLSDINNMFFTNKKFYIPSRKIAPGWPEALKIKFGIGEDVLYNKKIINLPSLVTPEMIEEERKSMFSHIRLVGGGKMQPPETLSVNDYLEQQRMHVYFKLRRGKKVNPPEKTDVNSFDEALSELLVSQESMQEAYDDLSEFEKLVYQWGPGYGYLIPSRDTKKDLLSPGGPKEGVVLTNKVEREYFFNIPKSHWSGVILALGQEPETDKVYWGFRRTLKMDWPFNLDGPLPRAPGLEEHFVGNQTDPAHEFVDKMNNLIYNLENVMASF